MFRIILNITFLLLAQTIFSQTIHFNGQVLDSTNRPIYRAKIQALKNQYDVKYSSIAGNYHLNLTDKDYIKIFPYPTKQPNNYSIYQFRYDPFLKTKGYLILTSTAQDIQSDAVIYEKDISYWADKGEPYKIDGDRQNINTLVFKNGKAHFGNNNHSTLGIIFSLSANTVQAIDRIKRQNQYVQGLTEMGQIVPNNTTAFSWGPAANSINMPIYDNDIYRTNFQHATSLNLTYLNRKTGKIGVYLNHKNNKGIFENNKKSFFQSAIDYEKINKRNDIFQANISTYYDKENLPLIGNSHANIILSSLLQPINFDIKNNRNTSASIDLDNPYYLMANNDSYTKSNTYSTALSYHLKREKVDIKANINGQIQQHKMGYGINAMQNLADNFTYYLRDLKTQQLSGSILSKYTINDEFKVQANIFHNVHFLQLNKNLYNNLNAQAYPMQSTSTQVNDNHLHNQSTEIQAGINYTPDDYDKSWDLSFLNSLLFTDRSQQNKVYNLQVEASKRFYLNIGYLEFDLLPWAKYHFNHIEPLQIYNEIAFSTIGTSSLQAQNYLPNQELLLTEKLNRLQSKSNIEVGFRIQTQRNHQLEVNYYNHSIKNVYVPILIGNHYQWENAADYKQYGIDITFSPHIGHFYDHKLTWDPTVIFQYYRNKTTKVLLQTERIAFAGFSDISKNYIVDQPVGVLVGTAYTRDANNQIIIDQEGYPEVNKDLKIIGNPNPDFKLLFNNILHHKQFSLTVDFEWSKGGDIWNGTSQVLNYYGQSIETAENRNITNYIFEGITNTGAPNTTAVDFYAPSQDITANRWVRYGPSGVAETAIEDASFLRMSKLGLAKKFNLKNSILNSFTINLFAENLLFISKYKGNQPNSMLFGINNAVGIDYFNSPALRKYGFNLNFNF